MVGNHTLFRETASTAVLLWSRHAIGKVIRQGSLKHRERITLSVQGRREVVGKGEGVVHINTTTAYRTILSLSLSLSLSLPVLLNEHQ